jgi:gliding motility-associated-like protein
VIVRGQCNEFRDTINIRLYKNPTVNLGKDLTYCEDEVIYRVLDVTTPNATSYVWQDGSALPTYIVEQTGIYSVTVSNICMSVSDEIEVKIRDCGMLQIWIPNVFTPDEDGMNDIFKPEINDVEYLREYEMLIYDRWGTLLFSTQDYLTGWNGKNRKNKECSIGVYTGIITYKDHEGRNFVKKISITLLR